MIPSQDLDLSVLESLSLQLSDALDSIGHHQLAMATPCADWDLSALVDHVTGGNWFTSRILNGQTAEDAMNETMKLFDSTSVTSEQAGSSVSEQLTAFRQPAVLDRTHHHVVGDLTGRQVLRLRLHDLIIHAWDIDQTLAPPASLPEDLLRWGLEELADDDSLTAKHFDLAATLRPEEAEDAEKGYLRHFGR